MAIKAIETRYNGYLFRSRLEARWAVFLDALHIPYLYESEGFNLDGISYLPDFWLPEQSQWMEVKGPRDKDGWNEAYLLAKHSGQFVCIMHGDFCPTAKNDSTGHGYGWYGDNCGTWPDDPDFVYWGRCPACSKYGIGIYGFHGLCGCMNVGPNTNDESSPEYLDWLETQWDWANPDRHQSIIAAYGSARSARFEHGRSGAQ